MAQNINTSVSQAVGTQRQFHKQEPATYQMSLKAPTFGAGLHQRTDYDTQLLVSSLRDFGSAIVRENERYQQQVYKDTQAMLQGASREDLLKMDAINLLDKYVPNLKNKSYARAIADNMKGKAIANDTYNTYLTDHTKYDTPEEAAYAYEQLAEEAKKAAMPNVKNAYAFNKAFNNGQIENSFKAANKQMQDEENERKQIIWIETDKNFKNLATDALTMDTKDFLPAFSEIVNTMRVSGAFTDVKKSAAAFNSFAEEVVRSTGNLDLLNNISDFVVDIDRQGKEHTFGEFVSIKGLAPMAAARQHQIKSEEYQKAYTDATACASKEELNQFYDGAKDKYDRVTYETLLKERTAIEHQIASAKKKADAIKNQQLFNMYTAQSLNENFERQTNAFLNDKDNDAVGTRVGSIYKTTFDKNGAPKQVLVTDKNELQPLIENKIANIFAGVGSQEDKFKNVCKLLTFEPCKFYAETYAKRAIGQLHTLDPEKLSKDSDGNYVLNPQLSALLRVRGEAGKDAELTFGGVKDFGEIDALRSMQNSTGSWNAGIRLYALSADAMKNDPKLKASYVADAKKMEFALDVVGLDGKGITLTDPNNNAIQSRMRDCYVAMRFANMDEKTATDAAQKYISENNYGYRGALIPKSVFEGYDTKMCLQRLDDIVYDYCVKNGYDAASVQWDSNNNKLIITGNGFNTISFTTAQLRNELEWYQNENTKGMSSNTPVDNLNAVGKTASNFGIGGKETGKKFDTAMNKNMGEVISDVASAIRKNIPDKAPDSTPKGNSRTEGIKAKDLIIKQQSSGKKLSDMSFNDKIFGGK